MPHAHPLFTAEMIADAIRSDLVGATQIKEFIKPLELVEMLGLTLSDCLDTVPNFVIAGEILDRLPNHKIAKMFKDQGFTLLEDE